MSLKRQQQTNTLPAAPASTRLVRAALYVAMLVLTIQLFCMAFHRHALSDHVSDCVSCYSASQVSGGPSVIALSVAASAVAVVRIAVLLPASRLIPADHFLTPLAHAPPAFS